MKRMLWQQKHHKGPNYIPLNSGACLKGSYPKPCKSCFGLRTYTCNKNEGTKRIITKLKYLRVICKELLAADEAVFTVPKFVLIRNLDWKVQEKNMNERCMTPIAITIDRIKPIFKEKLESWLTGVVSENIISSLICGPREVSASVSKTSESEDSLVFSSAEKARNAFLASLRASTSYQRETCKVHGLTNWKGRFRSKINPKKENNQSPICEFPRWKCTVYALPIGAQTKVMD